MVSSTLMVSPRLYMWMATTERMGPTCEAITGVRREQIRVVRMDTDNRRKSRLLQRCGDFFLRNGKAKHLILFVSSLTILTGCSGKLTRSKAQAVLDQLVQANKSIADLNSPSIIAQVGTVSGECSIGDKTYDPVAADVLQRYSLLKRTGMVTINPTPYPHVHNVALTEGGKQMLNGSGLYAHTQKTNCDGGHVVIRPGAIAAPQ